MLFSLLVGIAFALIGGLILRGKGNDFDQSNITLSESIDQLLPQTQCGECNYSGCLPYAEAISSGQAEINQCPPGGEATIDQLANLLGRDVIPLSPDPGTHRPFRLAVIDEDQCIGCTKCIQVCPVDAILGAAKQMHTVVDQYCTGCELCIPPCPVDCIDMLLPHEIQKNHHESAA